MTRWTFLVLMALALACRERGEEEAAATPAAAVAGVETEVAAEQPVRDVVEASATVTAADEPPDVRDARAALAETEARSELAGQQVRRNEALARGAVAPRKELEAARAEAATADAALARARQALAALGGAETVPAPAAGEVAVVARLLQPDMIGVEAGAAATLTADALPGVTFEGRVARAPSYVDPVTHLAPVPLHVRDPGHVLRPGMTGVARVDAGKTRAAVVVPVAAVVYDDDHPVVFVDEGAGRFAARPVEIGVARDGRVEVVRGIGPGVRVATTSAASLLSATRLPAAAD